MKTQHHEPKYDSSANKKINQVMQEWKTGKLKSGTTGNKVTSHKQVVAIAISEARQEGDRVPKKEKSSS